MGVWQGQFTKLRAPSLYNLRTDPFERGHRQHKLRQLAGASDVHVRAGAGHHCGILESFKDFPPRAKAASFSVSDVMDKITADSPNQN